MHGYPGCSQAVVMSFTLDKATRKASAYCVAKQPSSVHFIPQYTETLRTSVRESLQMHFKVAVRNFHAFNGSMQVIPSRVYVSAMVTIGRL